VHDALVNQLIQKTPAQKLISLRMQYSLKIYLRVDSSRALR